MALFHLGGILVEMLFLLVSKMSFSFLATDPFTTRIALASLPMTLVQSKPELKTTLSGNRCLIHAGRGRQRLAEAF